MTVAGKMMLWLGVSLLISPVFAAEPNRLTLEVSEIAGVHRDGAPVHRLIVLPHAVSNSTRFRLSHGGNPVVAQFRPSTKEGHTSEWWLDFVALSAPLEKRKYVIEYGSDIEPSPERSSGHKLIVKEDAFLVSNSPYIDWTVPRDLLGLLRSVNFRPSEHLRPESVGLTIRDRAGKLHRLGGEGVQARIVREGKMAVALQFEKQETSDSLRGVHWTADLVFPGPVSWVDVRLRIDDPRNCVAEAGLQLDLNLDSPTSRSRTLVELGASRTIYRSLMGNAAVELRADRRADAPWQVLRGSTKKMQPFVIAAKDALPAEGWAHVMDRRRCLAIAFADFGHDGEERLKLQADGRLTATKQFTEAKPVLSGIRAPSRHPSNSHDGRTKRWHMWLHFVHFPPQQSANTDPFMMQNPLIVRVLPH